jgi:hypothetical protein
MEWLLYQEAVDSARHDAAQLAALPYPADDE